MKIDSIKIVNFRGFDEIQLKFNEKLNVIIGKNGVGKTSVLESIAILSTGRSYKTHHIYETINQKKDESIIEGVFIDNKSQKIAKVLISKYFKKMWLNQTLINKLSNYIGFVDVVTFSSFDVIDFLSSPSERRKLFDFFLCGVNHEYLKNLQKYNNLIKEKNKVLKNQETLENINITGLLDVYDEQLYYLNNILANFRKDFVKNINDIYKAIKKPNVDFVLKYSPNFDFNKGLNEFCKNRNNDLKLKSSSVGIHKDDYSIDFNNMDLCIYGSQGQVKLALILLKICFATYIVKKTNRLPILLFDDVLGDLDFEVQNKLINIMDKEWQIIISTPSVSDLQSDLIETANIIFLE